MAQEVLLARNTLNNIKGYSLYDISSYRLSKSEADVCIKALELYIDSLSQSKQDG